MYDSCIHIVWTCSSTQQWHFGVIFFRFSFFFLFFFFFYAIKIILPWILGTCIAYKQYSNGFTRDIQMFICSISVNTDICTQINWTQSDHIYLKEEEKLNGERIAVTILFCFVVIFLSYSHLHTHIGHWTFTHVHMWPRTFLIIKCPICWFNFVDKCVHFFGVVSLLHAYAHAHTHINKAATSFFIAILVLTLLLLLLLLLVFLLLHSLWLPSSSSTLVVKFISPQSHFIRTNDKLCVHFSNYYKERRLFQQQQQ